MTGPRPAEPEHRPDPRPIWFVLSFYPRWWRQRYGEEFAALLTDLTGSASRLARARLLANALRGGLAARLAPTAERVLPDRSKEPLATIACAVMVFAAGVAGVAKLREGTVFSSVAHAHTAVGTSLDVLRGAAVLAGVAVLVGLVPLAWTVLHQVIVDRRPGLIGPLATGVLATGVLAPLSWFGLAWGLSIRSADAALFNSNNGLVSTPFAPNWAGSAMVLSAVTVVVFAATVRAGRHRPALAPV